MEDDTSLSVKDKIKAFETKQLIKGKEAVDHGKPTKRRPASKAFEEFENQGIIIGLVGAKWQLTVFCEDQYFNNIWVTSPVDIGAEP